MNRTKVIIAALIVTFFFANTAFALFGDDKKLKETEEKLAGATATCEKLTKDYGSLKNEYEKYKQETQGSGDKYSEIVKENEALKQDRNNLMAQAKTLLAESGRTKELEDRVARLDPENKAFETKSAELEKENAALKEELARLKKENEDISKKLANSKAGVERAKRNAIIKDLKKELSGLKAASAKARAKLAKSDKDMARFSAKASKLESEKTKTEAELDKYKKEYAGAVKKNKAFEADIKNMPKKFSEIARQNKQLIKETSEMHYNLGVFYVKNKEYERARPEFEKALDINPDDAYAHFNLGYIYAEHLVNRKKAVEQLKEYLRLAKEDDTDADWARKYILTWEAYEGKQPLQ